MGSLEFSVPYNNDPDVIVELSKLRCINDNKVREVYLSGPQVYSGSGRLTPKIQMNEFQDLLNRIHGAGLRASLAFNPTCESEWYTPENVENKMEFINQSHTCFGLESVIVANPIYIKEIKRRFPAIEVCTSVLSDIDSIEKAEQFVDAGADVIIPDVNINRNLELLKLIKEATGVRLKLMLNEGCLYKCAYRKFHFNFTSHKSQEIGADYWSLGIRGDDAYADFMGNCIRRIIADGSQVLKSCWIRPEDAQRYGEITNFFKIVGRNQPISMVIRTIKAYLEESWDGNILDLMCASINRFSTLFGAYIGNKMLDEVDFFQKVISCNNECMNCNYCKEKYNNLSTLGVHTPEKLKDMGLEGCI